MADIEVRLMDAESGEGFLIAPAGGVEFPASLALQTTDGSTVDVSLRVGAGSGASVTLEPTELQLSSVPTSVEIRAMTGSTALNDTSIEVLLGEEVDTSYQLTVIDSPQFRFSGRFQCSPALRVRILQPGNCSVQVGQVNAQVDASTLCLYGQGVKSPAEFAKPD